MATFKDFPPAQKAATFTLDQELEKMTSAATGGGTAKNGCENLSDLADKSPCRGCPKDAMSLTVQFSALRDGTTTCPARLWTASASY